MPIKDAPYDAKGNLMAFADGRYVHYEPHEWRENKPFEAALRIKEYYKDGSRVGVIWEDVEGHTYPMFFSEFINLVNRTEVSGGRTRREKWIVIKRGTHYGIKLA